MIHYIVSSESLRVVNPLQMVNSLRVLFLVCRGPLGQPQGSTLFMDNFRGRVLDGAIHFEGVRHYYHAPQERGWEDADAHLSSAEES